jgi:hypothetical protein
MNFEIPAILFLENLPGRAGNAAADPVCLLSTEIEVFL